MIFNTVTPFKRLLSRTGTQTKGFTFTHACMQQQQLQGSNLENIMEWQSDFAGMVALVGGWEDQHISFLSVRPRFQ